MEALSGLEGASLAESPAANMPAQSLSVRLPHGLHQSSLATEASSRTGGWVEDLLVASAAYCLTNLPVLLGMVFGAEFLRSANGDDTIRSVDLITDCIRGDAREYLRIIRSGYSYDPDEGSLVAFFPAYPLLSRWVGQATGLPAEKAALLVTHAALLGAFVLLARYVPARWPETTAEQRGLVLAIFGLWPMGLFFRMPYTEGLFVCSVLCVLYGMSRNWPSIALAILAGFATAVRPVGVALTAAFLWYLWTHPGLSRRAKLGRFLLLAPLSCWGLLTYMGYQWLSFGTPWAFAQTQEHWNALTPEERGYTAKFWSLATLEPIWSLFVPGHQHYWGRATAQSEPIFCLMLWNPIFFLLAGILLIIGAWKRWLNGSELVLGACLMAIPYLTRSCEMLMASHGRFSAVIVVNYLVIGRMMSRTSTLAIVGIYSACILWIFIFTSLYVASYAVF